MSQNNIISVAIDLPLFRLFDYLTIKNTQTLPKLGCRILVPFGQHEKVAVVIALNQKSDIPRSKLRNVLKIIDKKPLLNEADLWLIQFTSDYYRHPLGEVVASALPSLLRKGKSLTPTLEQFFITNEGRSVDIKALYSKAKRQAELLNTIRESTEINSNTLDEKLPTWRRQKKILLEKGWISSKLSEDHGLPDVEKINTKPGPNLNSEQRVAVESIINKKGFHTHLLDGVTSSGKTEVYLHIIQNIIKSKKQVLILVPEIGLTSQLVKHLINRIGIKPVLMHSSLTDSERLLSWRMSKNGSAPLVLGTRSAIFIPIKTPGLIVVDEEHDTSYKQQEGLRYSARDLAIIRGKYLNIPVILGSATPSLESLKRCDENFYQHLKLTSRAGNALPPFMRIVDLSVNKTKDGISEQLVLAIDKHMKNNGQVLIFLNRRGFAPTLICNHCGHIAECSRCDSRITVSIVKKSLECHHCGSKRPISYKCDECGGECVPLGQGTERIEEILSKKFSKYTIKRIDSDSTRLKGTMDKALALATSGQSMILVGTQMLSKGHHFPRLTLVGVVNADQGLFSTDFRGSERLAQNIIQVAGRAGREKKQGEVIIQTEFPKHPFWNELFSGGYHQVARFSMAERKAAGWPPFSHIALIRADSHNREYTWKFLLNAKNIMVDSNIDDVRILGPTSAPMERKAGKYRGQLLIQSNRRSKLHQILQALYTNLEGLKFTRRVKWSIDVDPIELF